MTFDPNNVKKYVVESHGQGIGDAAFVGLADYYSLLDLKNEYEVALRKIGWLCGCGPFATMYPEGFYGVPVQKMDEKEDPK
jgi:hypothetical protein